MARLSTGSPYRLLGVMLFWHIAGCATQAPAPPPAKGGIYHVVKPGETLYRIGRAYDLNYADLARVNRLRDPNQIQIGQKLFIPGAARQLPVEMITPADSIVSTPPVPRSSELPENAIIWPIVGGINSHFGRRGATFHDGIDISAQEGTPIKAIGKGEVIYSDQLRGYGNLVILRHSGGLVSVYAHNQVNLVAAGDLVTQGEIIAKVGSTGRVTGPHLHLEIRKNNVAQDPLLYLPQLCCLQSSDIVEAEKLIAE
ncbi:MAG TPA: M23 family metallopeptidase [Candidatus Polarisedimenticolaceae bacterium]|nr:M23 family metallopeptidase [Candidatus Polarisedimenticolaceae bacterium]